MNIDTSIFWSHQTKSYEFGKDKLSFIDGSDPGVGKTIVHAKIIENWLKNRGGTRALVVCPKTLVRSAWKQEFEKYTPDLSISLAEAPEKNRREAFNSDSDIVVMNIDGYKWLAEQPTKWLKAKFGDNAILINDESHTLKNPQAQRTKAAFKIAPYFKKRHVMSGTMTPNSIVELWSQVKIIDDGQRLGKRYTVFRNLMQTSTNKGMFTEWNDKPGAQEVAYGLIHDIVIRHKFSDVMTHVPDMSQHIVYYDLPKKHMDAYKKLESDSYIEWKGKSISAINAATLANKLLQCASGAAYNDPSGNKRTWSIIDSGRYELIADLVEGRQHCIVLWTWKHQRNEIAVKLKKRKIDFITLDGDVKSAKSREQIINDYQDGKYKCLLIHPDTAGYGLTITKASSIIFASPVYEAKKKIQSDARIRRGTQDKPTESIVVIARGTRDEIAYQVFSGKRDRLEALNNLFEGKK